MPVPFRELSADDGQVVGVLRIVPIEPAGTFGGALLLARGNGEPVEFIYNRLDVPVTSLCVPDRLNTFAAMMLVRSLFTTAEETPQWIMVCAGEVSPELFEVRLEVHLPVGALELSGTGARPDPVWLRTVSPTDQIRALARMLIDSGLAADLLTRTATALRDVVARDVADERLVVGQAAS